MRTRRSSIVVLLWTQAFYLGTIGALIGLAFAARAVVASSAMADPVVAVGQVAPPVETPVLVDIAGIVVAQGDGLLGVHETGAKDPVAFLADAGTTVTRDGEAASLAGLRPGDAVRMTVDGRTGRAVRVVAEPGATVAGESRSPLPVLAALVLIVSAAVVIARRAPARSTLGGGGRRPLVAPLARPLALRPRP